MFLSNRGSFRPETSGAYTLRRRGRRRPKSGSAIGACAVARLAGSGGPIGDYYGSANNSPDNAACEGFFGRLKVEFFHGRDWRGVSAERFAAELAEWIRWYREGRLKAFDEGGRKVYDTIAGRRRRLGLAA